MKAQKLKKVIISVTNDLVSDNRVHRTCIFFVEEGFDVLLIGRKLSDSLPINRPYKMFRFRLIFNKKIFFYAEYNLRLFFLLLFHRCDILVANDLDTLAANYYASKIKRCSLLYDSHEYFTEVPELVGRKKVKRIWEKIEQNIFPKLPLAVTVCDSIAEIYHQKYNIPVYSIRNVPLNKGNIEKKDIKPIFKEFKHLLIYQGALNIGRGIESVIDSMIYLDDCIVLLIIGKGDIEFDLHKRVEKLKLTERVKFLGKIFIEDLHAYTLNADLGFSLEEDRGLNYRFALPNKLFDYIHASVPIVCSDLPEMSKIVKEYDVGICLNKNQRHPEKLAQIITELLSAEKQLEEWKTNCKIAAKELNWEIEKDKLKSVLQKLVN